MKENLVSIIVPVYNAEAWIERCVNSIIGQTYKNLQLILIDDGSEDNTPGLLDDFKEKDHRIIVFHIKNGGVANARNIGLSAASGEFITFCDSDDYYEPDFIETLINLNKETGADLCMASHYVDFPEKSSHFHSPFNGMYKDGDISKIILKYFSIYCQSLCNKLFLTRIIKENKIDFPLHLSICEDSCFILDYILHINSVYCSDKPIYHYVQNNSASLTKRYNKEALTAENNVIKRLNSLANKYSCNNDEFNKKCQKHYYKTLCNYVFTCMLSGEPNKEKKRVFDLFKSNKETVIYAKNSKSFSYRIMANFTYNINKLYFSLFKIKLNK